MLDIIPIHSNIPFENICRCCRTVHERSHNYIQMVADGDPLFLLSDSAFVCSKCETIGVGVRLFETMAAAIAFGNDLIARLGKGEIIQLRAATAHGSPRIVRLENDQRWFVE